MRLLLTAPLLLALAFAAPVVAQPAAPAAFDPRTGDAWVDTWLSDINRYARAYREPFVDELVRFHGAPRELVAELLARPGWTPADIYYACSLAAAVGRPCRYVVDEYERDRGEGWGALAKRLGIEPGSTQFHRLKRGFVPTYDRWGRPIRVDPSLERDFPGRPRWQAPVGEDTPPAARSTRPARSGPAREEAGPADGSPTDRAAPAPRDAKRPGRDGRESRESRGKGRARDGG